MMILFYIEIKKRISLAGSFLIWSVLLLMPPACTAQQLRAGVFNVDVTPPIGSPVAYAVARSIQDPLSARGVVVTGNGLPIVLCAVDWIGIANDGLQRWQEILARAAGTTTDRVSIHSLHQHDAVQCDFTMAAIMDEYGMGGTRFDTAFLMQAINRVGDAVRTALANAIPVTHAGFGEAKVEKVASNRRILGKNGKVAIIRWSSSTDPAAIAAPEGLIDPWLKCVSLWNHDQPIAVLTYYATHPQSYYGQGDVTCEFVGIARNHQEKKTGVTHIHFNGASGNVAAGKYNDGSVAMRPVLADRVESAMQAAWQLTKKIPVKSNQLSWRTTHIKLPLGKNIIETKLRATLADTAASYADKLAAAEKLAWYQRSVAGQQVIVSCLHLGNISLLNVPGELFVEYQLAAQKMQPHSHVCMAAYEEYGPGYIATRIAYSQGGYETSDIVSGVAPETESLLLTAIKKVLQ